MLFHFRIKGDSFGLSFQVYTGQNTKYTACLEAVIKSFQHYMKVLTIYRTFANAPALAHAEEIELLRCIVRVLL